MVDMDRLADVVAQAIDTATAPLLARIAVLEKRAITHGRDGRDGKDAQPVDLDVVASKAAALIPVPRDGRDATVDIDVISAKAAALIPAPRDGRDGQDAVLPAFDIDSAVARALDSHVAEELVAKCIWPILQKDLPTPKDGAPGPEGPAGKDGAQGRDGRDGKDVDPAVVMELKSDITQLRAELLQTKSLQPSSSDLVSTIQSMVKAEVAVIPLPKDGKDGASVDVDAVESMVVKAVNMAMATLPPAKDGSDGRDGRDIDPAALELIVSAHVEKAFAAQPKPKDGQDGRSVTVDDVAPLVEAAVTKAIDALPDGVDLADALINSQGELVLSFSDGRMKSVGVVVGADADPAETARLVGEAVAAIPRPKDGQDGKDGADGANGKDGADGKDGLGFDDIDMVDDGEKCLLRMSRDGKVKEWVLPIAIDRGVYKPGTKYFKGAMVTAQGSTWSAQADTSERPGDGSTSWRLAVKKGRDGRDLTADGGQR